MFTAKYDGTRKYDEVLDKVLASIDDALHTKGDDFLLLCCGTTGTGKSMLMLHALDKFLGKEAEVKYIGLNRHDFAKALDNATEKPLPRFCANDEANISKRDSLTKYNKDMLDLYFSIRGLNIFHWWNNPSLDMLDKAFIEERIKGVIFITTKDIDRPRIYYYFRKIDLLKIWRKYGNLKLDLLKKVRKKYAYYRGWFKDYKGHLLQPYLAKKDYRMLEKVKEFSKKYGKREDLITRTEIRDMLQVSDITIRKYQDEMLEKGILKDEDVIRTTSGRVKFSKKFLLVFEEFSKKKNDNNKGRWKKNDNKKTNDTSE